MKKVLHGVRKESPAAKLEVLVALMPKTINAVIKAMGGHTR